MEISFNLIYLDYSYVLSVIHSYNIWTYGSKAGDGVLLPTVDSSKKHLQGNRDRIYIIVKG